MGQSILFMCAWKESTMFNYRYNYKKSFIYSKKKTSK